MKILQHIISIIIIGLILSSAAYGQKKRTQIADQAFLDEHYYVAVDRYKKAYSKVKNNKAEKSRIAFNIAECYRMIGDFRRAAPAYKRTVRMDYQRKEPKVLLYYADALKATGKYEEAIEQYNEYIGMLPEDPRGPAGVESCELSLEWADIPSKYEIDHIKKINSKADDFAPTFADKFYSSIIITTTRDGVAGKEMDEWTGQNFSDLFYAKLDRKGSWSTPVTIDKNEEVNTRANEGVAAFNNSFSKMYFTRCSNEKGESKGCQIFMSSGTGKSFGSASWIPIAEDTSNTYGHPTLSTDELSIIFASDRAGGYGGKDLWVSTREGRDGAFGRPENLGPAINTSGDEMFPFLRNDTVLFFASDRHIGMGGLDIFKSSQAEEEWSDPVNLKPPINTYFDDFGMVFRPEEESGFFSSNRKGGRGGVDIYAFIEPPLEFTLSGIIKDDLTLQFVEGVTINIVGSDGLSLIAKTGPKGYYNFGKTQIRPTTSYEIIVTREGYFNTAGKMTTVGLEGSKDFIRDFMLEPIPDDPVVLPDILYDLDKWDLKPQYQDSLQGLIGTLSQNPTIIVELASHTDARASDEYNDILSQKRAESVVNYLIERGIDPDRLIAQGYGEREPRTLLNDVTRDGFTFDEGIVLTEEYIESLESGEEKEAAHQLNRRTEFEVLSTDFVPKASIEEIATTTEIDIITEPQRDVVKFTPGIGEAITATCIVNGKTMVFSYIKNARGFNMSIGQALGLLKDGAITKNDFEGDPNEILANGTITDRAIFYLNEVKIGDNRVNDIPVTVIHDLDVPILFGQASLKLFGDFRIDYDKSEIVFD